jgi:hypothetical protein
MQGIKRIYGTVSSSKLHVSGSHLLAMAAVLEAVDTHPNQATILAAMLVAFFGLFRKDNISVAKEDAFNPRANLRRDDFLFETEEATHPGGEVVRTDRLMWVRARRSKTIQYHERVHYVPIMAIPGHRLCPVAAVRRAFRLTPVSDPQAPAFAWQTRRGFVPLTHHAFVGAFKALLRTVGVDPSAYSGHSFRRGGATLGFSLTGRHTLIQALGDWASQTYLRYDDHSDETKLELPSMMSRAVARL